MYGGACRAHWPHLSGNDVLDPTRAGLHSQRSLQLIRQKNRRHLQPLQEPRQRRQKCVPDVVHGRPRRAAPQTWWAGDGAGKGHRGLLLFRDDENKWHTQSDQSQKIDLCQEETRNHTHRVKRVQ